MKKKRGRPALGRTRKLTKGVTVKFSPVSYETLRFRAGKSGRSLAVYIREAALAATVTARQMCIRDSYGGTYAHKDIAFEFATWVSPQFKLYLLKEFQRLKEEEQAQLGWSAKRELSKINYRIHTDAIRQNLIPVEVTPRTGRRHLCGRGGRAQRGHVRDDRQDVA